MKNKKLLLLLSLLLSINLFSKEIEINKNAFSITYSLDYKGPTKVIYSLDKKVNEGNLKDRPNFYKDDNLTYETGTVPEDLTNTGLDRGHLAADASFDYNEILLNDTYSMANIVPQYPDVNRKVWKDIEEIERYNATQFGLIYVENIVLYEDPYNFLRKLPISEVIENRKFKNTEQKYKYMEKYKRQSQELIQKKIIIPSHFIKKMVSKDFSYKECYKVPNIINIDTSNVQQYKIDCNNI